jgi:hypothetical protein
VVEEEGEMYVTKILEPGSVVVEVSFFFSMKQTESARSKLNNPGALEIHMLEIHMLCRSTCY